MKRATIFRIRGCPSVRGVQECSTVAPAQSAREFLPHRDGGATSRTEYTKADLPFELKGVKKFCENTTFFYPNRVPTHIEGLHKWRPGCGYLRNWHSLTEKTLSRFDENSKLIVVDGPISAGKTHLCRDLAKRLGMRYFEEAGNTYFQETRYDGKVLPDWKWNFFTDLNKFYEDPKSACGHSSRLQYVITMARFYQYINCLLHMLGTGQGVIVERSPYSNWAFKDALLEMGYMTPQFHHYMGEVERKAFERLLPPHMVIYLDISPEESYKRIQDSGSPAEKKVDPEYLTSLDKHMKKYLPELNRENNTVTVQYDWTKYGDVEQILDDFELLDFSNIKPWSIFGNDEFFTLRILYQNQTRKVRWFSHYRLMPEIALNSSYGQQFNNEMSDMQIERGWDFAPWYKGGLQHPIKHM
jgi:NADH dehydrogenase (ubiquinone) 1 alpha subcomplex subunit 10